MSLEDYIQGVQAAAEHMTKDDSPSSFSRIAQVYNEINPMGHTITEEQAMWVMQAFNIAAQREFRQRKEPEAEQHAVMVAGSIYAYTFTKTASPDEVDETVEHTLKA